MRSLFFACILGFVFGILSVLKNRACNIIATVFVDIIRGVPMIVLAFYAYFAVPMLLNNILHLNTMLGMKGQITFSALQAGTICLALNCGAYMAEIIRAGIESVDKRPDGGSPQPGPALLARHVPRGAAAGNPYDDSLDHKPVYHYPERHLDPVGHQVSPSWSTPPKNVVANTMSAFQVWTIVAG